MTDTPVMSDLEQIVYDWLVKRKIIFTFQTSLSGGRFELGGSVVDFTIDESSLAWRVHGDYWHRQMSQQASDVVQRELLESQGWIVVDIWGSDLDTPAKVNNTLTKALRGEEVL